MDESLPFSLRACCVQRAPTALVLHWKSNLPVYIEGLQKPPQWGYFPVLATITHLGSSLNTETYICLRKSPKPKIGLVKSILDLLLKITRRPHTN
jgi:hypothetical protein